MRLSSAVALLALLASDANAFMAPNKPSTFGTSTALEAKKKEVKYVKDPPVDAAGLAKAGVSTVSTVSCRISEPKVNVT